MDFSSIICLIGNLFLLLIPKLNKEYYGKHTALIQYDFVQNKGMGSPKYNLV